MAYESFKDLDRRTASDKLLWDKVINIDKNTKYDGYQYASGAGGDGKYWTVKRKLVEIDEIHLFLLFSNNFLGIKTSKFQQLLCRCNLFDPN